MFSLQVGTSFAPCTFSRSLTSKECEDANLNLGQTDKIWSNDFTIILWLNRKPYFLLDNH